MEDCNNAWDLINTIIASGSFLAAVAGIIVGSIGFRKAKHLEKLNIEKTERELDSLKKASVTLKKEQKEDVNCVAATPLNTKNGQPYLEVHHIQWLSRGGEDTI